MAETYNSERFKKAFEEKFAYIRGFERNTERYSDWNAVTSLIQDKTWTYSELNEDCNKLAHAMKKEGVGKNNVVLYQLFNCPEFTFFYLAPQKIGAINSPMNYR